MEVITMYKFVRVLESGKIVAIFCEQEVVFGLDLSYARHKKEDIAFLRLQFENQPVGPTVSLNPQSIGMTLKDGDILIKDYTENQGLVDTLVLAGVVEDFGEVEIG